MNRNRKPPEIPADSAIFAKPRAFFRELCVMISTEAPNFGDLR